MVILGRDQRKGAEALASFGNMRERASFFPVDLSTHAGVRDAARRVLEEHDRFDAISIFAICAFAAADAVGTIP